MEQLKPPNELSFDGNLTENWKKWLQSFELFLIASGIDEKDEKVQCATFLHVAGENARTVYNSFTFEDAEKDKIEPLKKKFGDYFTPRTNLTYHRHLFHNRSQSETETFEAFLTDLQNKIKHCGYDVYKCADAAVEPLPDSLIKDRIICGIFSEKLQTRLLREPMPQH